MKTIALLALLCSALSSQAAVKIMTAWGQPVVNPPTNFATFVTHVHCDVGASSPDPAGNHKTNSVFKFLLDTNLFSALCMTEHDVFITNTIPPHNANGLDFKGQEITRSNHTLGIFLNSAIYGGYLHEALSDPQTVNNTIWTNGGFSVLAHPNYPSASWTNSVIAGLTNFNFVEIWNDTVNTLYGRSQGTAENVCDVRWAAGQRFGVTGGLDTHTNLLTTNAVNYVFVSATNAASLWLAVSNNDFTVGCAAHKLRVDITNDFATVHTYGVSSTIEWITNGVVARTASTATSDSYTPDGNSGYFRVRATVTGNTNLVAFSQPYYVTNEPGRAANGVRGLILR
jgi:hypothetical protein